MSCLVLKRLVRGRQETGLWRQDSFRSMRSLQGGLVCLGVTAAPAEHRPLVPGLSAAGRWPGCDPKMVSRQVGESEQSGPANKLKKDKHTNEAG